MGTLSYIALILGMGCIVGLGMVVGWGCGVLFSLLLSNSITSSYKFGVIIFILTKYEVSWLPVCKGLYWSWYTDNVIVEIRFRMSQFLFCTHKMPIMDSGVERAIYWATKWTRVISEWKTGQLYGHIKLQD